MRKYKDVCKSLQKISHTNPEMTSRDALMDFHTSTAFQYLLKESMSFPFSLDWNFFEYLFPTSIQKHFKLQDLFDYEILKIWVSWWISCFQWHVLMWILLHVLITSQACCKDVIFMLSVYHEGIFEEHKEFSFHRSIVILDVLCKYSFSISPRDYLCKLVWQHHD